MELSTFKNCRFSLENWSDRMRRIKVMGMKK